MQLDSVDGQTFEPLYTSRSGLFGDEPADVFDQPAGLQPPESSSRQFHPVSPRSNSSQPPLPLVGSFGITPPASPAPTLKTVDSFPLPAEVTELMDLYFSSVHRTLPFLHRQKTEALVAASSQGRQSDHLPLALGIFALAGPYSTNESFGLRSKRWYEMARAMLVDRSNGTSAESPFAKPLDIQTIQAWALIITYEMGEGYTERNYLSLVRRPPPRDPLTLPQAIATRLALMLGINTMDADILGTAVQEEDGPAYLRVSPSYLKALPADPVEREESTNCLGKT
jgi:hypothetical protein